MNLSDCPSPALAAQVVVYRSLGLNKETAMLCMAELDRRRLAGDQFDFSFFIEEELKKIPKGTNSNSNIVTQALSLIKNVSVK